MESNSSNYVFEYLPKEESSGSEVFMDALEDLPVETENNPTEKRWRAPAFFKTTKKATKNGLKTFKSKVCSSLKASQERPTEEKRWRVPACFKTTKKATKNGLKTFKSKVCSSLKASQERPTEEGFTFYNHSNLRELFYRYGMTTDEERTEWKYPYRTSEAFRRSDGQKVVLRFSKRDWPKESTIRLPGIPALLSEEMAAGIKLQASPRSEYLPRLHECYVTEQDEVLVREYIPAPFISLGLFIRRMGSSMKEKDVKIIMKQLFLALNHGWECGVYLRLDLEGIAINPNTLQIKITDFSSALPKFHETMTNCDKAVAEVWLEVYAKLLHSETYFTVMEALVTDINPQHLSKECFDLLWRLETYLGPRLHEILQNILNDPWFE